MAARVFINYRRKTDQLGVKPIYDRLTSEFGIENVFKDVDNIPLGADFNIAINQAIKECNIFIPIISPYWLSSIQDQAQQIDFVRIEIETALKQSKTIIPVFIGDNPIPKQQELPPSIANLVMKNAARIRSERFESDIEGLIREIKTITQRPRQNSTTIPQQRKCPHCFAVIEKQQLLYRCDNTPSLCPYEEDPILTDFYDDQRHISILYRYTKKQSHPKTTDCSSI